MTIERLVKKKVTRKIKGKEYCAGYIPSLPLDFVGWIVSIKKVRKE